jgi:hypothetical protein
MKKNILKYKQEGYKKEYEAREVMDKVYEQKGKLKKAKGE